MNLSSQAAVEKVESEESWVKITHQHWKVVLAFGLMVPLVVWVVLFTISATFRLNLHRYLPGIVAGIIILGSVVLAVPGFHLWIHGIICKACNGRPNLVAFGTRKAFFHMYPKGKWKACPLCGDLGGGGSAPGERLPDQTEQKTPLKLTKGQRAVAYILFNILWAFWALSAFGIFGLLVSKDKW